MTADGPSITSRARSGRRDPSCSGTRHGRPRRGRRLYKGVDEHGTLLRRVVNTGVDRPASPNTALAIRHLRLRRHRRPQHRRPATTAWSAANRACAGPWTSRTESALAAECRRCDAARLRPRARLALLADPRRRRSIRRSGRATALSGCRREIVHVVRAAVNVRPGQVLPPPSTNDDGKPQDISHVSRFVCQR